jgi:hypothetical protein
MKNYFEKNKEENFESIIGGKHQKHGLNIYSHWESGFKNPKISGSRKLNSKIEEMKVFKKLKFDEVEN